MVGWNSILPLGGQAPLLVVVPVGPQFVQGHFTNGDPDTNSTLNNFIYRYMESSGAGNCLGIMIPQDTTAGRTVSSISDNINGSWSTTPVLSCTGASTKSSVYLKPNCGAGQTAITVNFSGGISGPPAVIFEASGIDLTSPYDGGSQLADQIFNGSTAITCGSFMPGHSGSLVLAFFTCSTGILGSGFPTSFVPSSGFSLLSANIAWNAGTIGLPYATSVQALTGQPSVTPAMTPTGDTVDKFNCIAIALKATSGAGTPRPSGPYIAKRFFFFTNSSPAGNWNLQIPMLGNTRLLSANGGSFSSVTDSEGNSWHFIPNDGTISGSASPQMWYWPNASPNPNLTVACTTEFTAGQQARAAVWDIMGCASSPLGANAWNVGGTLGSPQNDMPDITPTKAGSRIICYAPCGNGPTLSLFNPTNAVFENISYTNEGDAGAYNSGDGYGHIPVTAGQVGVSQAMDWTVQTVTSTGLAAHAVEFKGP